MSDLFSRKVRIIAWMVIYGALWGAIAGGLSGAIIGFFIFIIGALFGIPYGAFYGAQIGALIGLVCGLITLWFDARSMGITRTYRVCITTVSILLTPLLVNAIGFVFGSPQPEIRLGFPLALMVLGMCFAALFSRKLVNVYRKRFIKLPAPSA